MLLGFYCFICCVCSPFPGSSESYRWWVQFKSKENKVGRQLVNSSCRASLTNLCPVALQTHNLGLLLLAMAIPCSHIALCYLGQHFGPYSQKKKFEYIMVDAEFMQLRPLVFTAGGVSE